MTHARGHIVAPPEVRARRKKIAMLAARRPALMGGATLPLSVDLSQFITGNGGPGIPNQGDAGACEGFAFRTAIGARMAFLGKPIARPAALGIYKLARRIDLSDMSQPLADSGTMTDSAEAAVSKWGVVSETTWGELAADGTPDMNAINVDPDLSKLEKAALCKFNGAYALTDDMASDQLIVDILTALAAGYLVCYSLPASGADFQNYSGSGTVPSLTGPIDHENVICGCTIPEAGAYDQAVIKAANSWDITWGDAGFYTLTRAELALCDEPMVVDVEEVGSEQ